MSAQNSWVTLLTNPTSHHLLAFLSVISSVVISHTPALPVEYQVLFTFSRLVCEVIMNMFWPTDVLLTRQLLTHPSRHTMKTQVQFPSAYANIHDARSRIHIISSETAT